jgi:CheY-like chemotaxis protein
MAPCRDDPPRPGNQLHGLSAGGRGAAGSGAGKEDRTPSLVAVEDSERVGSADRPPARSVPGRETSPGAATVLVVEDNEMVRRLAVRILEKMGFRVLEAADGVEALEVFEEHRDRIRVVLCDVTMPRMGGWETLSALRRIDPEIPVILTSGYDEAIATAGSHPKSPMPSWASRGDSNNCGTC